MKPILHDLAHSPFCLPVKRILEAWAVPHEVRPVSIWDRRSLLELTGGAYYMVPVLEHGGGLVHETRADPLAVAHFLDREFCGGALFPEVCAGLQEVVIGHIEDTLEGIGFKLSDPGVVDAIADIGERGMAIRHKERRFGPGCVEAWRREAAALTAAFEAALQPYERRAGHSPFLFGERPVYADFALFGVIANAEYSSRYALPETLPNLKRWLAALREYYAV